MKPKSLSLSTSLSRVKLLQYRLRQHQAINCSNICYKQCARTRGIHSYFSATCPQISSGRLLRRLVFKGKGAVWPTVTWKGTELIVYYLGEDDDDVVIKETREINFDEFFLHLDCGGSIFVTMRPPHGNSESDGVHPKQDTQVKIKDPRLEYKTPHGC